MALNKSGAGAVAPRSSHAKSDAMGTGMGTGPDLMDLKAFFTPGASPGAPSDIIGPRKGFLDTGASSIQLGAPLATITRWEAFSPTREQQAIMDAFMDSLTNPDAPRHLIVEALAGSGKTTVLQWLLYHWRKHQTHDVRMKAKCLYLAFGRRLADESREKFVGFAGYNWVMTSHQYGYAAIRAHESKHGYQAYPSDSNKRARDAAHTVGFENRFMKDQLVKLAGWWRNGMLLADLRTSSVREWTTQVCEVADAAHDPVITEAWVKEMMTKRLPNGLTGREVIQVYYDRVMLRSLGDPVDFDDMIRVPMGYDLGVGPDDLVMVDELQDWNPAQVSLLERIANAGARIVAVGDRNQSIFAFRSGPYASIAETRTRLERIAGVRTLPMTISQRCSVAVSQYAAGLVPDFKHRPQAKPGCCLPEELVSTPAELTKFHAKMIPAGTGGTGGTGGGGGGGVPFILARTNSSLIPYALYFWRRGIPFRYDFNIGKRVSAILDTFAPGLDLLQQIKLWKQTSLTRYYGQPNRTAYVEEIAAVLEKLCMEVCPGSSNPAASPISPEARKQSLAAVKDLLLSIQGTDESPHVILSTVHGAKGLEADTVFLVGCHSIPHPMASRAEWELEQERNIAYVAVTRARETLIMDEDFMSRFNKKEQAR